MTGSATRKPRPAGGDQGDNPKQTASLPGRPALWVGSLISEKRKLEEMIPAVILPDGYRGKILLVLITMGEESLVVLRSGDLWHREILRNTKSEVFNLGLTDAQVNELGGASLFFEADGSIRIWGGSDEFGACDRDYAAALVRAARPGCAVVVSFGEMA
jgi:hypothetical protein